MKIGIFSDVHGNFPALKTLFDQEGSVDQWLCCGDITGHLPFINEVVEIIKTKNVLCIMGNHDYALIHNLKIDNSYSASIVIKKQISSIKPSNLDYLRKLPIKRNLILEGYNIEMVHGGNNDNLNQKMFYIDEEIEDAFDSDILFYGHTHREKYHISKNGQIFINPGSVGLPVYGDWRGSYVIFDTKDSQFTFHKIEYDRDPLYKELIKLKYPNGYISCLEKGTWESVKTKKNTNLNQ